MNYIHIIPAKKGIFVNRILQSAHNVNINHHIIFSSQQAWFDLHGEVNSKKTTCWDSHKPTHRLTTAYSYNKGFNVGSNGSVGIQCNAFS